MRLYLQFPGARRTRCGGFSTVELVVSMAVILIASAIALPVITTALRSYQLSDRASRLAGIIKLTRFDAIRRNTPVTLQFQQTGATWTIWDDSNNNTQPDPTEPQMILTGDTALLPQGSAPAPSVINASLGTGNSVTPKSGANGAIYFDQRGAVITGIPGGSLVTNVFALYLGNPADASYGYRAVIVLPSGAVQVWTASSAADWRRLS
jgi:Tfp pilus assembly protein FimT